MAPAAWRGNRRQRAASAVDRRLVRHLCLRCNKPRSARALHSAAVRRRRIVRQRAQQDRSGAHATSGIPCRRAHRSEEHTSELQSLMRISYAVFCLKKKNKNSTHKPTSNENKKKDKTT